jgi:hypothetical protein
MPQLHLYVSEEVASRIRKRARARRMPVSRYLAELVLREVGDSWPAGYFDEVIGGWLGDDLERPPQGTLESRTALDAG